jgi:hypothetical protein
MNIILCQVNTYVLIQIEERKYKKGNYGCPSDERAAGFLKATTS